MAGPNPPNRAERALRVAKTIRRAQLAQLLDDTFGGRRNFERALGYPPDEHLTYETFYARYRRDGLMKRIINLAPATTWSGGVEYIENDDPKIVTTFEKNVAAFAKRTKLFPMLRRFDTLSRIGEYAVLLIGVREPKGTRLDTPLEKVKSADDVLFFSPYSQPNARILSWDLNPSSERYCMPETYLLTTTNLEGIAAPPLTVHWTRTIHAAEGLLEDNVFGEPAGRCLYNAVLDAAKTIGASAEAVWKIADRGTAWVLDKDADVDDDFLADMDKMLDEMEHDQRRNLPLQGVTPHVLGSEMVDPRGIWEVVTGIIATGTGYPRRIMLGSERGELASQEDRRNFAGVIGERRENYAEPDIARAVMDRLMKVGAFPELEYGVSWPSILVETEQEKADKAAKTASAVRLISDAGAVTGRVVMTVPEFREKYLGLDPTLPAEAAKELDNRVQPAAPFGKPGNGNGKQPPSTRGAPLPPSDSATKPNVHGSGDQGR